MRPFWRKDSPKQIVPQERETAESAYLYDRYPIDTAILKRYPDVQALRGGEGRYWSDERRGQPLKTVELLKARYQELAASSATLQAATDEYGMYCAVANEWKEHYFLPRAEQATLDQYNDLVVAKAQLNTLRKTLTYSLPNDTDFPRAMRPWYRATASIDLVPLTNGPSFELIVPPGIDVAGDPGRIELYKWDDLTAPHRDYIYLFPSTRDRIANEASESELGRTFSPGAMDLLAQSLIDPDY